MEDHPEDQKLEQVNEGSNLIYLTSGHDHQGVENKFGTPKSQLVKLRDRGSNIKLAQWLGIVNPGLILAEHQFEGLKRPLCAGEDMGADRKKLLYTWCPASDFCWKERNRFDSNRIELTRAPDERVFAVVVTPNARREKYPSVDFWIEEWFWVRRSQSLSGAPIDWENRFDRKLK